MGFESSWVGSSFCSLNYSLANKPKKKKETKETKTQENNKQKEKNRNFTEEEIQWFTNVWKYAQPHESFKKRKIKEHEMSPFAL